MYILKTINKSLNLLEFLEYVFIFFLSLLIESKDYLNHYLLGFLDFFGAFTLGSFTFFSFLDFLTFLVFF